MVSLKALGIMVVWTAVAVFLMNILGFPEHSREPLWTLGGAVALLIILMVNVWIFFMVAKDQPWKWFKE